MNFNKGDIVKVTGVLPFALSNLYDCIGEITEIDERMSYPITVKINDKSYKLLRYNLIKIR